MADAAVSKTAIFGCASSTLASGTISNRKTPLFRGVFHVCRQKRRAHPFRARDQNAAYPGRNRYAMRRWKAGRLTGQDAPPSDGAAWPSLRHLRGDGANRALCSTFRRPLAEIARCVACDGRRLSGGFRAQSRDLGFCESERRRRARFSRFGPIGCCTSAHLCQRPRKSTAQRHFCANSRAHRPGGRVDPLTRQPRPSYPRTPP